MRKLKLKELRNGEYIQYLDYVISFIKQEQTVEEELKTYLSILSNKILKLERLFKIRGHKLTIKIAEADHRRDRTFKGFKNIIKGCLYHDDLRIVGYAEMVMVVLEKYGLHITSLGYMSETTHVDGVLMDLEELESSESVLTKLGVKLWVDNLRQFNNEFNRLYLERVISKAQAELTSVSVGRKETDKLFRKMIRLLEAIVVVKEAKGEDIHIFLKTIDRIDELTYKYYRLLRLRKARRRNKKLNTE